MRRGHRRRGERAMAERRGRKMGGFWGRGRMRFDSDERAWVLGRGPGMGIGVVI